MPGVLNALDTGFPEFTGNEPVRSQISAIQDYLFMLREQLFHTLFNLDMARNMNKASVQRFAGEITGPVYGRIEGAEGKLAEFALSYEGLVSRVSDAEGNISYLSQTVNGFTLSAEDSGGNYSTLRLTSRGVLISTANIVLSGLVSFYNLANDNSSTVINGGNIRTGTISGVTLRSEGSGVSGNTASRVQVANGGVAIFPAGSDWGSPVGGLQYDINGQAPGEPQPQHATRLFLYTNPGTAMKIRAGSPGLSIEARGGSVFALGAWRFDGDVDLSEAHVTLRQSNITYV